MMVWSAVVYFGCILLIAGGVLAVKPVHWIGITTSAQAIAIAGLGIVLIGIGFTAPTAESRVSQPRTRLDEFTPVWQFGEFHSRRIAAPPERVFAAIRTVRADEIFLFRALTWIRRGGRPLPESILNAGDRQPLIDVALRGGFVLLADEAPRELVIGTAVRAPDGARDSIVPALFLRPPPGYALAAMNFHVVPDGSNGSIVATETRVFANGAATKRRFAAYWRVIYPGSAVIRRMWLRAIERRATRRGG